MNVTMLLDMAVDGFGERIVVGAREHGMTAKRLKELSDGAASQIALMRADSVLYLAANGQAFPVALFAAARAGVPLVPVNDRLGPEQLDHLIDNHSWPFVIADEGHGAALQRAGLIARTPAQFLADAAAVDERGAVDALVHPDSPAAIVYTSGTTSMPKGVVLRHANLVSYVVETVEYGSVGEDDAALVVAPPHHIAAVSTVLTNLYAGRRAIFLESFTPRSWLAAVREHGVTNAVLMSMMLAQIMDEPELDRSVPSLRSLAYGGAAMPVRTIEMALREWREVDFVNAYGLTETSSTVTVLGPGEHRSALCSADAAVRARLRSAGRAVPGIEIEVRDLVGDPVPTGETGQIWVRGAQVSTEYAGLGSSVDARGWLHTRDFGRLDEEDYLFVEGRTDDTIICGGDNIAPAEIEDVLLRQPEVADAVVVGMRDEEWGERIEAVVVARPGVELDEISLDALRASVRSALCRARTPARIVCWSEIPRTPSGKLVRREVVGLLESADGVAGRRGRGVSDVDRDPVGSVPGRAGGVSSLDPRAELLVDEPRPDDRLLRRRAAAADSRPRRRSVEPPLLHGRPHPR